MLIWLTFDDPLDVVGESEEVLESPFVVQWIGAAQEDSK